MTNADIFIQILSEVSGRPEKEISDLLKRFREVHPGGDWDAEVPFDKAKRLLADLRKEAPRILCWLAEGAARVSKFEGNA